MDIKQLADLLEVNAEAGTLTWKVRPVSMFPDEGDAKTWNTRYAGKEAFTSRTAEGRAHGTILRQSFYRSRVIWALVTGKWPTKFIDHIDGNVESDAISNLREVNASGNARNQKRNSANRSGRTGVFWNTQKQKWHSTIKVHRKNLYLGMFDDFDQACKARSDAEKLHGFHPNHGRG